MRASGHWRVEMANPVQQGLKPAAALSVFLSAAASKWLIQYNKDWNAFGDGFLHSLMQVEMANPVQQGLKPVTVSRPAPQYWSKWLIQYNKDWNRLSAYQSTTITMSKWLIQYNKDWNEIGARYRHYTC